MAFLKEALRTGTGDSCLLRLSPPPAHPWGLRRDGEERDNKPSPSLTGRLAGGDIFIFMFPGPQAALLCGRSLMRIVQLADQ